MSSKHLPLRINEPVLAHHQHPLFASLTEAQVEALLDPSMRRGYRRGMFLFVEGDPIEAVYCLLAGRVKAYCSGPDGREQIVGLFGSGHLLPPYALQDGARHGNTAEATQAAVVLRIPLDALKHMLERHPCLLKNYTSLVEQYVRAYEDTIRNLALYTVPQRIGRVLLREAERSGKATAQGYLFRFTWTQQDLAHLVGTTRESVSRTLADFRRAGVIEPAGKGLILLNSERLSDYF